MADGAPISATAGASDWTGLKQALCMWTVKRKLGRAAIKIRSTLTVFGSPDHHAPLAYR
jgi:hypothetical protein